MRRFGTATRIMPGQLAAYRRLHDDAWPGVLAMLTTCHITNYSIFHRGDLLFSYFEYAGQDFQADSAVMASDPTTQEWWALCHPCLQPLEPQCSDIWSELEEIFHLD